MLREPEALALAEQILGLAGERQNGTDCVLSLAHVRSGAEGETGGRTGLSLQALATVMAAVARGGVTEIDLRYNAIPRTGGLVVAEAVASNSRMQVLRLSGNALGDAGAAAVAGALRLLRRAARCAC